MPTIKGTEINNLVSLFQTRNVVLYHACQLTDFKTYLEIQGVPSRNLMESAVLPHTPFDTDKTDKKNEVWDKVFLNLEDFGFAFAKGKRRERTAPTPNPYGPILLAFEPEVLTEAADVSVCLRSAGAENFDREEESLGSIGDIDKIFKVSLSDTSNKYKADVKFKDALKETFPDYETMSPEVNCAVPGENLSFAHLKAIIVDEYTINNKNLLDEVRRLKNESGLRSPVWKRFYNDGRPEIKQELAEVLTEKVLTLDEIIQLPNISEELRDYVNRLIRGNMHFFFDRFAKYLHFGTLKELSKEN